MSPAIPANSFLIFHHFIYSRFLKVGCIIRVKHPIYGQIVKVICKIDIEVNSDNEYWLEGLNPSSVSSEQMGAISLNMITGINFYKIQAS